MQSLFKKNKKRIYEKGFSMHNGLAEKTAQKKLTALRLALSDYNLQQSHLIWEESLI